MGDEKDLSATTASEAAPATATPAPVSVPPRPVSIPPRPGGAGPSRMPPPPSARGMVPPLTASPGAFRSAPPPPPVRNPASALAPAPAVAPAVPVAPSEPAAAPVAPAPISAVAASPSVVPRAPATPPPPPHRSPSNPVLARPSVPAAGGSATAQLEQRLGAAQVELRKLGSERHTLRARLRREADRVREVESALRAEKELRSQASDEHFATSAGLRQRLAEVEGEAARREAEAARLQVEVARLTAEVEQARQALATAEARTTSSAGASAEASAARAAKLVQGLRRIRGIGPGYQRLLEQLGVTRVQQVAAWSSADVASFAEKLRIKPERIKKDDWVGQARALEPDPEE